MWYLKWSLEAGAYRKRIKKRIEKELKKNWKRVEKKLKKKSKWIREIKVQKEYGKSRCDLKKRKKAIPKTTM